jgi:hypothetical protein
MEELNLFEKLTKVKAPSDFEQKVMVQLSIRRERKFRTRRVLRFSFAGAMAFFLIAFIMTNVISVHKKGQVDLATLKKSVPSSVETSVEKAKSQAIAPPSEVIPITEAVDYSREVRSLSPEPQTIYILEQVSDTTNTGIKY